MTDCHTGDEVGKITGGKGYNNNGGAVYLSNGTFTMYNGNLTGNTASYGGAVYLNQTYMQSAKFALYGGTITGNTATQYSGGAHIMAGTFEVAGSPRVIGNTAAEYSSHNVYLNNNKISIGAAGLSEGAEIDVTPTVKSGSNDEPPEIYPIADNCTEDYSSYFSYSSDLPYAVQYDSTNQQMQLKLQPYTVTFHMNGHGTQLEPVQILHNRKLSQPANPIENGYVFENWYADGQVEFWNFFVGNTRIKGNTTLNANWSPRNDTKYTVNHNFEKTDGTYETEPEELYGTTDTDTAAEARTMEGFTAGTVTQQKIKGDGSTVVEINYTRNTHTLTFKPENGEEDIVTTVKYGADIVAPTDIEKTGHTFNGWGDVADTMPDEDVTYTAQWTVNTYTVILKTNEGTIEDGEVTEYTYGIGAALPTKVTRSDYFFDGWYDNEACEGDPVTEITATDIGDKTFYAAWTYIPPHYLPVVADTDNGSVTVSPTDPTEGTKVTITTKPEEGYETAEIIVTDKAGNSVEVIDNHDDTYSFTQPAGEVTIKVTFGEATVIPFVDVSDDAYYADAVLWAVKNKITFGTSDTEFSPNEPCTRAQTVAFLWRAAGCPTPTRSELPFTDVRKGSYYEMAVLWGVENGIIYGTSATTFSPDDICSRAQFATFLWRLAGMPDAGTTSPFTDVERDAYYADAVLWAAENGITEGTSPTTFSPDKACIRAQTVTFLYRYLSK